MTGTADAADRAYWPSMSCQRVAEPISGRASVPSGISTNTAVGAAAGGASEARVRSSRGAGGTGLSPRASWRSAWASRASVSFRRAGANGKRRVPGFCTAGIETCLTRRLSSERATFFTSTATTSPLERTKYAFGSLLPRSDESFGITADSIARVTVSSLRSANWPKSETTTTFSSSSTMTYSSLLRSNS